MDNRVEFNKLAPDTGCIYQADPSRSIGFILCGVEILRVPVDSATEPYALKLKRTMSQSLVAYEIIQRFKADIELRIKTLMLIDGYCKADHQMLAVVNHYFDCVEGD